MQFNYSASQLYDMKETYAKIGKKLNSLKKEKMLPDDPVKLKSFNDEIDSFLNERYILIGTPRIKLPSDLGIVNWLPNKNLAVFVKLKRKPDKMGFSRNGQIFLHPEEALYLFENESIILCQNDVPLSLEDAYNLLFSDNFQIYSYCIYSYLSRLGYRLKRHSESTISSNISHDHSLEQKLPSLEPMKSNSKIKYHNSELVTYYLETEMFQKTLDRRPTTWKELKKLDKPEKINPLARCIVIEANDESYYSENFPSQCLISENLSPLVDQTKLFDVNNLFNLLQNNSCKTSSFLSEPKSDIKISYDAYLPSKTKSDNKPDFMIVIVKEESEPPDLEDLLFMDKLSNTDALFAVIQESDFNFYWFKTFPCWDELPSV